MPLYIGEPATGIGVRALTHAARRRFPLLAASFVCLLAKPSAKLASGLLRIDTKEQDFVRKICNPDSADPDISGPQHLGNFINDYLRPATTGSKDKLVEFSCIEFAEKANKVITLLERHARPERWGHGCDQPVILRQIYQAYRNLGLGLGLEDRGQLDEAMRKNGYELNPMIVASGLLDGSPADDFNFDMKKDKFFLRV